MRYLPDCICLSQPWMKTTMAYLADSPAAEWGSAVCCCIMGGLWGWHITKMRLHSANAPRSTSTQRSPRWALVLVVWLIIVAILSFPSVSYTLSLSLPSDQNSLGMGSVALELFQHSIGLVLYVVSAYAVPTLARKVVECFATAAMDEASIAEQAGELMMLARFMIVVLAPGLTVLLTTQSCFANWCACMSTHCIALSMISARVARLILWTPCSDSSTFETNLLFEFFGVPINLALTTHESVCAPVYIADAHCPRCEPAPLQAVLVASEAHCTGP